MFSRQAGSQGSIARQFAAPIATAVVGFVALSLMPAGAGADEISVPPTIQVPEGFTVELVAGPPLVQHPTMAGFDERGRLFVADGPGLNLPADTATALRLNPAPTMTAAFDPRGSCMFRRISRRAYA